MFHATFERGRFVVATQCYECDTDGIILVAHSCLPFSQWAAFGSLLLPRDFMLKFSADAVRAADSSETHPERKFHVMWSHAEFASVRNQYERMLQQLPEDKVQHWKDDVGLVEAKEMDVAMESDEPETQDAGGELGAGEQKPEANPSD